MYLYPRRFKIRPSYQNIKVYPFKECLNFGYGITSKIPQVLCKG